ncbi:unnamed protein product [Boreogadus saida]
MTACRRRALSSVAVRRRAAAAAAPSGFCIWGGLLCSEHFVSGAKQDNPLSPAFVPSLFAHTSVREREKQNYVFQKFLKTQQRKRKIRETSRCLADPSTTDVADMEEHEVTTDHNTDHSYSRDTGPGIVEPCVNPSCQATTFALESECAPS